MAYTVLPINKADKKVYEIDLVEDYSWPILDPKHEDVPLDYVFQPKTLTMSHSEEENGRDFI